MTEADKLFETLGYKIETNESDLLEYKKQLDNCSKFIRIDLYNKTFTTFYYILPETTAYLDMQELQAINLKCKEMKWIEE